MKPQISRFDKLKQNGNLRVSLTQIEREKQIVTVTLSIRRRSLALKFLETDEILDSWKFSTQQF